MITPKEARNILQVSASCSPQELQTAFRNAALKCHPDHGGNSELFKKINEAYEFLLSFNAELEEVVVELIGSMSTTSMTNRETLQRKLTEKAQACIMEMEIVVQAQTFLLDQLERKREKFIEEFGEMPFSYVFLTRHDRQIRDVDLNLEKAKKKLQLLKETHTILSKNAKSTSRSRARLR